MTSIEPSAHTRLDIDAPGPSSNEVRIRHNRASMATSSRQSDPINDGGKDLYHESVAEIMPHPPPTPPDDDYDEHDEKDMSRIGKKQELRVCPMLQSA